MAHTPARFACTQTSADRSSPKAQQAPAVDKKGAVSPATVTWFTARVRKTGAGVASPPALIEDVGRMVRLFDLPVFDTSVAQAADWIVNQASRRVATQVAFINAHCVNVMYRDANYRDALASADRIFADGSGLSIAAKVGGFNLADNVNGTDLFPVLCKAAAKSGISIFLFGGQPSIADGAAERMCRETPGLSIAGTHDGFIEDRAQEERLISWINASGAQILLVGMGVPKQELWIQRNRHRLEPAVIIGVGGLFDYFSGRIARAPAVIRAVGFEWAWRLALEPRRLARRYLFGNIEFLVRVALLRATRISAFKEHFAA